MGKSAAGEEYAESVVVLVVESSCDSLLGFGQSVERHREQANSFESHTRIDTICIHPDQPIPNQPESYSQTASVSPLLARSVSG